MSNYYSVITKTLLGTFLALLLVGEAAARDDELYQPISAVLNEYSEELNSDVALYFGNQSHSAIAEKHGEFPTNKKTNAFGKSDEEACRWVMLSALLALQERAVREGGNAVVNIRSYYDKNEYSSETEYECHAGKIMAGVALIGEVVTLQ
ncbi:MAG TPA: excinuclease ATPase subunit [Cellvibrionaceae bacterium]